MMNKRKAIILVLAFITGVSFAQETKLLTQQGTFWWCAYDQLSFAYPPYNYASVEAELGLIKEDRTPKPVMQEMKMFSNFLDKLPFKTLPERKTEAKGDSGVNYLKLNQRKPIPQT